MVDPDLAILAGTILGVGIVVSIPWALALSACSRAGEAELALAQRERDEQRARAEQAERAAARAADAARAYLSSLPPDASAGAREREWLLRALDATAEALGTAPRAPTESGRPDDPVMG